MAIFSAIGNYLRIPPYVLRMQKIALLILVLVHLCTCMFWLIKTVSTTPEDFADFCDTHGVEPAAASDLWDKYLIAFYFTNTVRSAVGFRVVGMSRSPRRARPS